MKEDYKFLNNINFPSDIRKLSENDLQKVSDEVRKEMISAVSETGGHLGAGLGVVELTVALHYVFDTPNDKLIWDVGHQSYPHKILTGRKSKIRTLRQGNGLSGFTKRSESEYDPFGAAHSSTSISSALGIKCLALFMDSPVQAYGKYSKNIEVIVPEGETEETTTHDTLGADKISFEKVFNISIKLLN